MSHEVSNPPQPEVERPRDTVKKNGGKKPKKHFAQLIFRDWCKACGICSAFCPKGVISRSKTGAPVIENPQACIGCRFCELHCPDFAITIRENNGENGVKGK